MSSLPASPSAGGDAAPSFEILGARPRPGAMAPVLDFRARITESVGREIYTIALTCQVNIDPAKRRYDEDTRARLVELFGEPQRWGATTKSFMWQSVQVLVPSFSGETTFDIPLICNYDTEIAATKYFYSVPDGQVPLTFLFSGSIFFRDGSGGLTIAQVPWACDARYQMPLEVWRQLIARHYPNQAWVSVHTETLDKLQEYKAHRGLPSYDACVADLLELEESHRKEAG